MARGSIRRSEWRRLDRDITEATPRVLRVSLTTVLIVFVLIAAIGGLTWLWAPWKGEIEQRSMTQGSGSYRIAAYEKFYDDCASVQSIEDQIATMQANKDLPKEMRAQNVLALQNRRTSLIRQYNADSRKEDTQAAFKASDLPYTLDPTQEVTSCSATE